MDLYAPPASRIADVFQNLRNMDKYLSKISHHIFMKDF